MEKKEISTEDINTSKTQMRREYLEIRNRLSKEDRQKDSRRIQGFLEELPQYDNCQWLFCYVSYRSEVETRELLCRALQQKKKVAVPKVMDHDGHMEFYQIHSLSDLLSGYQGILEPDSQKCKLVHPGGQEILMLLPGAAFDMAGGRVGYGGGYYDRYLNTYRKECGNLVKFALAYECQISKKIVTEPFDVRVDGIVTENGVYIIKGNEEA